VKDKQTKKRLVSKETPAVFCLSFRFAVWPIRTEVRLLGLSVSCQTTLHNRSLEQVIRNHSLELLVLHIRNRFRS